MHSRVRLWAANLVFAATFALVLVAPLAAQPPAPGAADLTGGPEGSPYTITQLLAGAVGATPPAPVAAESVQPLETTDEAHRIYLPLVSTGGQPSPPPSPTATDQELIAAALSRGEINSETALLYRAYAAFLDPRLPAQFRGASGNDAGILDELALAYDGLTPEAQVTLAPFLLPPYHTGSWWEQAGTTTAGASTQALRLCDSTEADIPLTTWRSVESPDGKVRVWWQARYPEDAAKAEEYARVVGVIWQALAALMGREPPSDNGTMSSCRGGDDRLDISLVDLGIEGLARSYSSTEDGPSPSYILINRTRTAFTGRGILIHELMHAFQNAFQVSSHYEYRWWKEATAEWAIHYVEEQGLMPNSDLEHNAAKKWLVAPQIALEAWTAGGHQYGSYLLPLFLQADGQEAGALVRQSFERAKSIGDSLENLNGLLAGGFAEQFPEFTLHNVNRPPVDLYWKYDSLEPSVRYTSEHAPQLGGDPYRAYSLDGTVGHLSSHVFHFKFNDPAVRAVLFENPYPRSSAPTAHVRAIYRADGDWYTEDWTNRDWVPFCRDLKAERITELTVVISNSEWSDRAHILNPVTSPKLHITNVGCRGWQVEASVHATYAGQNVQQEEHVAAEATMLLDRDPQSRYLSETYRAVAGTATWSHTGTRGDCTGNDSGSYSVAEVPDGSVAARLHVEVYGVSSQSGYEYDGTRRYRAVAANPFNITHSITYVCPNSSFLESMLHPVWLDTGPTTQDTHVSSDGQHITGTYTESSTDSGGYTITRVYTWKMEALPPE